jgi:hypothetical protein
MTIWYIFVHLVHFCQFWYHVPRKIWQPWCRGRINWVDRPIVCLSFISKYFFSGTTFANADKQKLEKKNWNSIFIKRSDFLLRAEKSLKKNIARKAWISWHISKRERILIWNIHFSITLYICTYETSATHTCRYIYVHMYLHILSHKQQQSNEYIPNTPHPGGFEPTIFSSKSRLSHSTPTLLCIISGTLHQTMNNSPVLPPVWQNRGQCYYNNFRRF